jgi:group I intron endonuclease
MPVPLAQFKTGVYVWHNRENGKVYVGGAYKSFEKRKETHLSDLRIGKHPNQHLQSAWNLYGEDAFEFVIIERRQTDGLAERETWWISEFDATNPEFGYNKSPTGGSPLGTKHPPEYGEKVRQRNLNMSEETKARIGAASRGRTLSTESRAKISATQIGRQVSEETRRKISEALIGHLVSEESREKMSEVGKARITPEVRERLAKQARGRIQSQEEKDKRAASLRGRKRPAEVVEKVRLANIGKARSDAARANISKAQKLRFAKKRILQEQENEYASSCEHVHPTEPDCTEIVFGA